MRTTQGPYNLTLRSLDVYGRVMDTFNVQARRYVRRSGAIDFRLIGPKIQRTVVSKRRTVFSHIEIVVPVLEDLGFSIRPKLPTSYIDTDLKRGDSITFVLPRILLTLH
jgi:hypothetical protein